MDGNKIISREYKLMLDAASFRGDGAARKRAVERYWRDVTAALDRARFETTGEMAYGPPKKQRLVRFFDTRDHALRRDLHCVYRLRRRRNKENSPWCATFKFRHGDRVQAAALSFRPKPDPADVKFEEDIKTPHNGANASFVSLYSRSANADTDQIGVPTDLSTCLRPFKGLAGLSLPDLDTPVMLVNEFEACEHLYSGANIRLAPKVTTDCAVVIWTRSGGSPTIPLVAEVSFRFDFTSKRSRSAETAKQAWEAYRAMRGMVHWVNVSAKTKTAYVYEGAG